MENKLSASDDHGTKSGARRRGGSVTPPSDTEPDVMKSLPASVEGSLAFRSSSLRAPDVGVCDTDGALGTNRLQSGTRRDSIGLLIFRCSACCNRSYTMTNTQVITLIVLSLGNFCNAASYSIMAPFFPKEASSRGIAAWMIGLIFGIFELVIFLTAPIFGALINRIGSFVILMIGLFLSGTSCAIFGLLDRLEPGSNYVSMCLLVRITQSLGCSAFMTASFTVVAATFPTRVATMFGCLETFNGLGLMVGPVIGGALYQADGFYLPFAVTGGTLLLSLFVAAIFLPRQSELRSMDSPGSTLRLLIIPHILIAVIGILLNSCALGFIEPTLPQHLEPFGLGPLNLGLVFLVPSGMYALSSPLWGYIVDKFRCPRTVFLLGNAGVACSLFFLGPSPMVSDDVYLAGIIVSLAFVGIFVGAALVAGLPEILTCAMKNGYQNNLETYAFVSAVFSSSFSLGAFVGPTGGGYMMWKYGFPWTSTCLSFVMIIATVLMFAVYFCSNIRGGECSINDPVDDELPYPSLIPPAPANSRTPLLAGSDPPNIQTDR